MSQQTSRRQFLQTSAAIGAGLYVTGSDRFAYGARNANEKLNIAVVGVGGRGGGNLGSVSRENIVALCDVDEVRARGAFRRYPQVPKFKDFRQMLEKVKNIDAVVVSTPDHTHAHAAIAAMKAGKHVYCEKPLTHSVWEARQMQIEARRNNVITQMGNQGTSQDGFRDGVEYLQAGRLGTVREIHVWTNRPIWPQGVGLPTPSDAPRTLDWDLWLGPAAMRPFSSAYVPFKWRGFWDFGTGALGDMACHTMNLPFMGMRLAAPTKVSANIYRFANNKTAPMGCVVNYEFPARGDLPPLTMKWYERSQPPRELFQGERPRASGSLILGSRGTMYSTSDYGNSWVVLSNGRRQQVEKPDRVMPRVGGRHHQEWIEGIRNNRQPASSFITYASKLTETALLGNVAMLIGLPFSWDTEKLESPDCPKVAQYVRTEYRRGWDL